MTTSFGVFGVILLLAAAMPANAAQDPQGNGDSKAPAEQPYPSDVSLVQNAGVWTYLDAPSGLRLYSFDGDAAGKSSCNDGCASTWPPLLAHRQAKPMGDWTLIVRHNGQKQWAYKGHPAYRFIHDSRAKPVGNGIDGRWHLLQP